MNNPFEILDKRLHNIECMLLDLKYPQFSDKKDRVVEPLSNSQATQTNTEKSKGAKNGK